MGKYKSVYLTITLVPEILVYTLIESLNPQSIWIFISGSSQELREEGPKMACSLSFCLFCRNTSLKTPKRLRFYTVQFFVVV